LSRSSDEQRVDPVFGALADATRRSVLKLVADEGPLSATDLADQLPVSRQAVVKHLQVLAEAGLVSAERNGREVLYGFEPAPLHDALAWAADVGSQWDTRLAKLRRHLVTRRGASAG
jgi:DNA-binding transcriptional ArsR family regulator